MRPLGLRHDAVRWAIVTGALIRIAAFPFVEEIWGDAPVRSDIALAWAQHPGFWWSYAKVLQFGPLPTHLEGVLIRLGVPGMIGARLVPLLAGIAGIALAARLARRFGRESGAALAAWAVALCPLHIQASTTCTSEAIYFAFALTTAIAILERRVALAALAALGASTTRYDAWIWIPVLGALLLWRERASLRSIGVAALLLLGPLSILAANAIEVGRPLAPLVHVSEDHGRLAAEYLARYGALGWRAINLGFWPFAIVVGLTPLFGAAALAALRRRPSPEQLVVWSVALVPVAVYVVRGAATGAFVPMLRMAMAPALLVLCTGPAPRWCLSSSLVAALFDASALLLATIPSPVASAVAQVSPVERLPDDLRAGVTAILTSPGHGRVRLDQSARWEDIVMAHHARRDRFELYAARAPLDRVVAIDGAPLDAVLEAGQVLDGQVLHLVGRLGRISWWEVAADR